MLTTIVSMKRIVLFFGVVVLSGALVPAFYFWLFNGKALLIESFSVAETEHVKSLEIQEYTKAYIGKPFYGVDMSRIADSCGKHPWVKRAVVRRLPPHTIVVKPAERIAVGVLDNQFLFDEDGVIFLKASKSDLEEFPQVQTKSKTQDVLARKRVADAILAYATSEQLAGKIDRIVIDDDECLHVYFDDQLYVELGSDKFVERWQKLDAILKHLRKDDRKPDFIYLGNYPNPRQVAVKLRMGNGSRGYINGSTQTR